MIPRSSWTARIFQIGSQLRSHSATECLPAVRAELVVPPASVADLTSRTSTPAQTTPSPSPVSSLEATASETQVEQDSTGVQIASQPQSYIATECTPAAPVESTVSPAPIADVTSAPTPTPTLPPCSPRLMLLTPRSRWTARTFRSHPYSNPTLRLSAPLLRLPD